MKHNMKLKNGPFKAIESGVKTIEMRLYDEKRRLLNTGDEIEFLNLETGNVINTKVVGLHIYRNFEELYQHFNKEKLGYKKAEVAKPEDMEQYYSREDILKYGVVGIEIELI